MNFANLLYENQDGIAVITMNRPKALNALNQETLDELNQVADMLAKDSTVQVVILTGSGDKAFVAGADIAQMQSMSAMEGRNFGKLGQAVFNKLENLPQLQKESANVR